jgi:putative peptidoglycan lipid II flippase
MASERFVRHANIMSVLTTLARVSGLLRDKIASYYLGVGTEWGAFWMGFTLPNLFRRVFGEGALTAAVVPAYTRLRQTQGQAAADKLASTICSFLVVVLGVITVIGEAVLLPLALQESFAPANRLALWMMAIMLPYCSLVCLVAILSAIHTVHERFIMQSLVPGVMNLVFPLAAGLSVWLWGAGYPIEKRIYWAAGAVLVAGVIQVAMMLPGLHAAGVRVRPTLRWTGSGLREVLVPMVPIMLAMVAIQIGTYLDGQIAWWLSPDGHDGAKTVVFWGHEFTLPMQAGALAKLSIAQRIYQLPVGIFGVALATAVFPLLSKAVVDNDTPEFKRLLVAGLRKVLFLAIPCSAGMILIAHPLITLVYSGKYTTPADVDRAWWAAMWYCAGIVFFELQMVLMRAYYAQRDTMTPAKIAALMVGVSMSLNLLLIWPLAEGGIAAATSINSCLQCLILLLVMRRRLGGLDLHGMGKHVLRIALVTLLMALIGAAVIYTRGWWFEPIANMLGLAGSQRPLMLRAALELPLQVGVCGVVFVVAARLLKMPELYDVPMVGRILGKYLRR